MPRENYLLDLIRKFPEMLKEKKLIAFLIDGLGTEELNLPFLKKSIYRTVFPSSTPTFFYSFHSLLEPKEHGFLEWFMRFRNFKKPVVIPPWTDFDGNPLRLKKKEVFPFKPLSEILWEKGFSSFYYTPFANSIFTQVPLKRRRLKILSIFLKFFLWQRKISFSFIGHLLTKYCTMNLRAKLLKLIRNYWNFS
jgi:hypothetical protein